MCVCVCPRAHPYVCSNVRVFQCMCLCVSVCVQIHVDLFSSIHVLWILKP